MSIDDLETAAVRFLVRGGEALRSGAHHEALAQARLAASAHFGDADWWLLHGNSMIQSGAAAQAMAWLERACASYPEHSRLLATLSMAAWDAGRHAVALAAVQQALTLSPRADFATQKGWMQLKSGDLAGAEITLRDAIARFPERFSAYKLLTDLFMEQGQWIEAAAAAEQAVSENPADPQMRENWVRCLIVSEQAAKTLEVIAAGAGEAMDTAYIVRMLIRKGEAYQQLREIDAARDAWTEALELEPEHAEALERISALLESEMRASEARPYRARARELHSRNLPDRLSEGLEQLWEVARNGPADSPELAWGWDLADKTAWDWESWRVAANWGEYASRLLGEWWLFSPKPEEIDALLDKADLESILYETGRGRACALIGAHVGPLVAAHNHLRRAGIRYRTFGSAPDRLDGQTVIAIGSNYSATKRALIAEIEKGTTVGLMGDAAFERMPLTMDFLGRTVNLPAFVPRLIQAYGLVSFWACPLWHDGRVVLDTARLPDPLPEEPRDAWAGRWFLAYLERLERVMRGRPENLGLYSGIWSNVNETELMQIRRIAEREAGRRNTLRDYRSGATRSQNAEGS